MTLGWGAHGVANQIAGDRFPPVPSWKTRLCNLVLCLVLGGTMMI